MKESHRGPWHYSPLARMPRRRLSLGEWLNRLFSPLMLPEGRNRIDPANIYGAWTNGYNPPALPEDKKSTR